MDNRPRDLEDEESEDPHQKEYDAKDYHMTSPLSGKRRAANRSMRNRGTDRFFHIARATAAIRATEASAMLVSLAERCLCPGPRSQPLATLQRVAQSLSVSIYVAFDGPGACGLPSHMLTRRRAEIGLRMALGATRRSALRLIVGDGMGLALGALMVGLLAAGTSDPGSGLQPAPSKRPNELSPAPLGTLR